MTKPLLYLTLFLFLSNVYSQNPNDCEFAIKICGTSSFNIEPIGVGNDEFQNVNNIRPTCYSFNRQTVWFEYNFLSDGEFLFTLRPDVPFADFDFAVYGPVDDCSNLGSAIRCSSTNPGNAGVSGDTGLNTVSTDVIEGPGQDGDGFLMSIDVSAGETYYLLIDRPHDSGGFKLLYTGTAALPPSVEANPIQPILQCDNNLGADGLSIFDLESLIPEVRGNQNNTSVSFYENETDAISGTNTISLQYEPPRNPKNVYARIEGESECFDVTSIRLETYEIPFEVEPLVEFCATNPGTSHMYDLNEIILQNDLNLEYSFHLSEEDATNDSAAISDLIIVDNNDITVYTRVYNEDQGCTYVFSTVLRIVETQIEISSTSFNNQNNSLTVIVSGVGDYLYSIDGVNFQESNVFSGLTNGIYTLHVLESNDCGIITRDVIVLDYPRFFTPNDDGFNDEWRIIGLTSSEAKIRIFDRYGKLLKDLNPVMGWDGIFNSQKMPSSDYWFVVEFSDGQRVTGHFTLKR